MDGNIVIGPAIVRARRRAAIMARVLSDVQKHLLAALIRRELAEAYRLAIAAGTSIDAVLSDVEQRRVALRALEDGTAY
jgi:hypothetical protein